MAEINLIDDLTKYFEGLCRKHAWVLHSDTKKHFVRLDKEEQLEVGKTIHYPAVSLESLTCNYPMNEDSLTKGRHIEMMFLDRVSGSGDFVNIEKVKAKMETIAEDFLRKIRKDRKDRKTYPILKAMAMSEVELDYVEGVASCLYGVILSFNISMPFKEDIEEDHFTE